jgi:hypothetical protein
MPKLRVETSPFGYNISTVPFLSLLVISPQGPKLLDSSIMLLFQIILGLELKITV